MLILHAINTTDIQRIAPALCLKLSLDFRQSSRNIESNEKFSHWVPTKCTL